MKNNNVLDPASKWNLFRTFVVSFSKASWYECALYILRDVPTRGERVKMPAATPNDLSSVPRSLWWEKIITPENCPVTSTCVMAFVCAPTHTIHTNVRNRERHLGTVPHGSLSEREGTEVVGKVSLAADTEQSSISVLCAFSQFWWFHTLIPFTGLFKHKR